MITSDKIKETFEQKNILSDMIFEKTGRRVNVEYGELLALGEWFYVERTFLGSLRLGTSFDTSKFFITGFMTKESLNTL